MNDAERKRRLWEAHLAKLERADGLKGPTASPEERRASKKALRRAQYLRDRQDPAKVEAMRERSRAGYRRKREDPEAWAAHLERCRQRNRERYDRIKADPEAYAAFLEKRREYARAYRDRRRSE